MTHARLNEDPIAFLRKGRRRSTGLPSSENRSGRTRLDWRGCFAAPILAADLAFRDAARQSPIIVFCTNQRTLPFPFFLFSLVEKRSGVSFFTLCVFFSSSMFSSLCSFGESFQNDEGADEPMRSVYVNVYDMRPENNWGFHLGIGVWHTGVQLFNSIEVTFGGHPGSFSGVFSLPPKSVPLPLRHSIKIGTLNKSPAELRAILEQISEEYPGNSYNILNRNCNHFSDDLCRRLVGKGIPPYINRLAGLFLGFSFFFVFLFLVVLICF